MKSTENLHVKNCSDVLALLVAYRAEQASHGGNAGWRALKAVSVDLHRRPSEYTAKQIEAEIGAAHAEVRTLSNADSHGIDL